MGWRAADAFRRRGVEFDLKMGTWNLLAIIKLLLGGGEIKTGKRRLYVRHTIFLGVSSNFY